ncbi:hypothetical protein [Paenibacillus sp. N3.4]|uniref:hypothetical protein n=1 Tax=Paenibacillus sp. N3.4 TaxID=2603222 RepID=UPI0011CA857D|nr:hypothetical protein [Paenibacillus sp. N3.4]TXK76334.1 hypothetical protein FU659_25745 [Paenibacillus sp. N3.4]
MSDIRLIEDYKLEAFMVDRLQTIDSRPSKQPKKDVKWSQLVQYAVNYVIHDLYALPQEQRTAECVAALVENRWTNRHYKFESFAHFKACKQLVIDNLTKYVKQMPCSIHPILLFEQWRSTIPPLNVELSMIFQVAFMPPASEASGLVIQKFIVEDQVTLISTFVHMTAVFCLHAFGHIPDRIEVYSMLSDNVYSYRPHRENISSSYDYMKLVASCLYESKQQQLHLN